MTQDESNPLADAGNPPGVPAARPHAGSSCAQCDANIFNVSADGMCPSCGTPVILSDFVRGPLTALPRATLKTMESGARLVGTATLLWAGGIVLLCTAALRRTADAFQATGAEVFVPAALLAFVAACLMLMGFRSTAALPDGLPRLRRDMHRSDVRRLAGWGIGASITLLLGLGVSFVAGGAGGNVIATALLFLLFPAATLVVLMVFVAIAAARWLRLSDSLAIRAGGARATRRGWIRSAVAILIPLPLFLAAAAWVAFGPETSPSVRVSNAWVNALSAIAAICHAPALLLLARTAIRLRHLLADARRHAPDLVDYPGRPVPDRWREPRFFGLGPAKPQAHEPDACAICDYDLAGLAPDMPCPECNAAAPMARARPRLLVVEPRTLRSAHAGILLLAWSMFVWFGASVLLVILQMMSPWNVPLWVAWGQPLLVTVCGISASLGLWRGAFLVPVTRSTAALGLARVARICAIISVPALLIGWIQMLSRGSSVLDPLIAVLRYLYIVWIVMFWFVTPLMLRVGARRLNALSLFRWSSSMAIVAIAWVGLMYGLMYTLYRYGAVAPGTVFDTFWSLDGPIRGGLHLVTGIIALRLARRLRHAATAAAALREPTPPAPPAP